MDWSGAHQRQIAQIPSLPTGFVVMARSRERQFLFLWFSHMSTARVSLNGVPDRFRRKSRGANNEIVPAVTYRTRDSNKACYAHGRSHTLNIPVDMRDGAV
jgi:hypothetical protein